VHPYAGQPSLPHLSVAASNCPDAAAMARRYGRNQAWCTRSAAAGLMPAFLARAVCRKQVPHDTG
jgi:hypothetical protein